MKLAVQVAALVLLAAQQIEATAGHRHHHQHPARRHAHVHAPRSMKEEGQQLEKKSVQCKLPDDPDLVYVPGAKNNGFAMSPDQPCTAGMYCPIACKSGKVMAQWEPGSSYTYPSSMNGGLHCGDDGQTRKPFEDAPYCVDGTGKVSVVNKCGKPLSFCQTVLPGNEAMLIPTIVGGSATLAVPGPSYWCSTSAHYYVNPPGTTDEGCVWGDSSKPIGNWAPYIAGANTDGTGNTYVTLGSNPIFEKEGNGLEKTKPSYGLRINCPGGGCNGLPCEVGGADSSVGQVKSNLQAVGAGGSSFCVVTVPANSHAEIEVFNTDGSTYEPSSSSAKEEEPEPTPSSSSSEPSSTSSEEESSTSTATSSSSSKKYHPTVRPGIFHENGTTHDDDFTSSGTTIAPSSSPTNAEAVPTESQPNEGVARQQGSAAIASLIVALVAAAYFY